MRFTLLPSPPSSAESSFWQWKIHTRDSFTQLVNSSFRRIYPRRRDLNRRKERADLHVRENYSPASKSITRRSRRMFLWNVVDRYFVGMKTGLFFCDRGDKRAGKSLVRARNGQAFYGKPNSLPIQIFRDCVAVLFEAESVWIFFSKHFDRHESAKWKERAIPRGFYFLSLFFFCS